MQRYTNPFEAMTVANSIMVKRGLDLYEGNWSKEIISYTCDREYIEGQTYYGVKLHLTQEGFNAVKEALGTVDYVFGSSRVNNDPYVRFYITIDSVLTLLVLVLEEDVDAIVAL